MYLKYNTTANKKQLINRIKINTGNIIHKEKKILIYKDYNMKYKSMNPQLLRLKSSFRNMSNIFKMLRHYSVTLLKSNRQFFSMNGI